MAFTETVNCLQTYQNRQLPGTVSLSRLIEFSIQRTYHELVVLTELLPRKSDIERKIEIVNFANRTRQLFIRLLALVKWAGSASKVEKCSTIVSFLDKQSSLFMETADILAKMSRETLVQARLPSFQLPCAVEVLTLGSYSRLPTCIRDRIVPPDNITPAEKRSTLLRLNHIIQQRLVSSHVHPQMRNLRIEYGRVIFHVDHEFELTLTLMGDNPAISWRVLQIDILVEDKETGEGKDLVHPLQVAFLQHIIQNRLSDNTKPLLDAYNFLHCFCLSLQLEVLHVQSIRLFRERLGDFIRVDEYVPGKKLSILYWKDNVSNKFACKLFVEIDNQESSKPLQVYHSPELGEKETTAANQAIKSDHLSIERLLIHTTHERAKEKLNSLQRQLAQLDVEECVLSGSPPVLQVSCLKPSMPSERLFFSVDTLTGIFLAHIPQFDDCPIVDELLNSLTKDVKRTKSLLQKLRIYILRERFKKTAELLPVHIKNSLPFTQNFTGIVSDPCYSKLYLQFTRHHRNYLAVVFNETDMDKAVRPQYFMISAAPVTTDLSETSASPEEADLPRMYLKVSSFFELDISSVLRPREDISENNYLGKRKLQFETSDMQKKCKSSSFFIPEFAHLISFCEEKLSYGALSCELQRRSICHQVRTNDEPLCSHLVDIVKFPPDSHLTSSTLGTNLLSCTIRLQGKTSKIWQVTLSFCKCPIQSTSTKEHSSKSSVYLMYDFSNGSQAQIVQLVDELLEDWSAIEKLYDIVCDFAAIYPAAHWANSIEIKSYSYKKLVIGYGPNKNCTVAIRWKSSEKRFQLTFSISGAVPSTCIPQTSSSNPHMLVATQLQHEFNQHLSIATLVQTLHVTFNPLSTVQSLNSIPLLGVINSKPQVPVQTFCVIPQSSTHIRLLYRNVYCVDITFQADELVAIRDGAYSLFDKGKVLEELAPIQGLKAFLSKFVDKTATQMRRLSQTEDDNPPSPVSQFDSMESYLFQTNQSKTASPLNAQNAAGEGGVLPTGIRNVHQTLTSGSLGSNPNTPASPHTSMLSQANYVASPSAPFSLASPPSHGLASHQPSNTPNQIAPSPSIPLSHTDQSPANLFNSSSPVNPLHAPSPSFLPTPSPSAPNTHMQSPAPNFMTVTSQMGHEHSVNSPFQSHISMPSPHSAAWPGSPSIPRPSPSRQHGSVQSPGGATQNIPISSSSAQHYHMQGHMPQRLLPQRSWAAAIPTLLTHQGFETMCKPHAPLESPQQQPHMNSVFSSLSQLERFLGCVFMRKNLQRAIQSDQNLSFIHSPEPGIIQYKNETMQFKISLHPTTMQSLHSKILPVPEYKNQWLGEELEILEKFFDSKVVSAPYKPNALLAYNRLLNTPPKILKDCIQLMRLEMYPERGQKWTLEWCLTIPPSVQAVFAPPGMSAFYVSENTRMLFFMQFTRVSMNLPVGVEPKTIVAPFVYDLNRNSLQVLSDRTNPILGHIHSLLSRFAEYSMQSGECPIFPAIREILVNDLVS